VQQGASAVADVNGDAGVVVDTKMAARLACVNVQLAGFSIEASERPAAATSRSSGSA
jgi:hypothetical protein